MVLRKFNYGHREELDYPFTAETCENLGKTYLVSPRPGNDHGYEVIKEEEVVAQMDEVRELRDLVKANIWPTKFLEKYLGKGSLSPVLAKYLNLSENSPKQAADTVRMDHPFDIWDIIIEPYAKDNGVELAKPRKHEGVDFVETVLERSEAHRMIAAGLDKSFDVKYYHGSLRPLEYHECSIQRYQTPTHPEMPAGHGAFAGSGARAFEAIYKPTEEQKEEIIYATKQFAMFRSFSAMHIAFSNLLGWDIGYELEG